MGVRTPTSHVGSSAVSGHVYPTGTLTIVEKEKTNHRVQGEPDLTDRVTQVEGAVSRFHYGRFYLSRRGR